MSREMKNTLLLQGSILAAAGILTKLIGFLYRIPMANLLGNQGNGVYSIAYGIYTVTLTLSSMSLPTAVSKVVSARLARDEHRNAARVLAIALVFALLMGTFSFSLLYFGAHMLEEFYQTEGLWRPLRILAPTSFLFAFLGVMRGYTQGSGSMVPTAISQIVDQCFNAVISIVAAWALLNVYGAGDEAASWGAMGGTLGTLAGAVTSFLFMAFYMLRRLPEIRLRARRDASGQDEDAALAAKALLFTILPIVFSQTVYQIGYTIDDMVFSRFMNTTTLNADAITSMQGVFNTQYNQMVNLPVSIATAMAMTLMPSIVASHVQQGRKEVRHKITSTVKFNMAIAIPSAVGLAVLADPIMALLFPSLGEYHDLAAGLLRAGSSAAVFYALSTITTSILQGHQSHGGAGAAFRRIPGDSHRRGGWHAVCRMRCLGAAGGQCGIPADCVHAELPLGGPAAALPVECGVHLRDSILVRGRDGTGLLGRLRPAAASDGRDGARFYRGLCGSRGGICAGAAQIPLLQQARTAGTAHGRKAAAPGHSAAPVRTAAPRRKAAGSAYTMLEKAHRTHRF